jgi:hypothetical protein
VRLIHPVSFDPADFQSTTIEIFDVARQVVVQRATVGPVLDEAIELPAISVDDLRIGVEYRVRLSAVLPVCAGPVVGESVPFVHREESYVVSVQIGCADQFTPTRRRPNVSRFAASLVTASDGSAMLAGGAREVSFGAGGAPSFSSVLSSTERYDPVLGNFVPAGSLTAPRAGLVSIALDDGTVAVFGGATGGTPPCSSNVDRLFRLSVSAVQGLEHPRCGGAAAIVRDGGDDPRILVAGGALLDGSRAIEIYDASANAHADPPAIEGLVARSSAELVPLAGGTSALLVGGTTIAPIAERVTTTGSTAVEGGPSAGLRETAAVYVACPHDGAVPGVVYLLGGLDGAGTRVSNEIWCYADDGSNRLVRAGELAEPRRAAVAVALRARADSGSRVLLVGGTPAAPGVGGSLGDKDAVLVSVDGCSCALRDSQIEIAVPIEGDYLIGHAATLLADGSVLVVGGLDLDGVDRAVATGEAVLFIPELP